MLKDLLKETEEKYKALENNFKEYYLHVSDRLNKLMRLKELAVDWDALSGGEEAKHLKPILLGVVKDYLTEKSAYLAVKEYIEEKSIDKSNLIILLEEQKESFKRIADKQTSLYNNEHERPGFIEAFMKRTIKLFEIDKISDEERNDILRFYNPFSRFLDLADCLAGYYHEKLSTKGNLIFGVLSEEVKKRANSFLTAIMNDSDEFMEAKIHVLERSKQLFNQILHEEYEKTLISETKAARELSNSMRILFTFLETQYDERIQEIFLDAVDLFLYQKEQIRRLKELRPDIKKKSITGFL